MALEGLWTIQFRHSLKNFGTGVVVLTKGKILGGDAGFWYSGDYSIDQDNVTGKLLVARFAPNHISVFGAVDQFELLINFRFTEHSFNGTGSMVGHQNLEIEISGSKKQDL